MKSNVTTRYMGNRPIKVEESNQKLRETQDTFDAMFLDEKENLEENEEDTDLILSSTPVVSQRHQSRKRGNSLTNNSLSLLNTQEKLQLSSWGLPGKYRVSALFLYYVFYNAPVTKLVSTYRVM